MSEVLQQQVGVVAIGRNEGERLVQCLRSVVGRVAGVVYVDSGSTDGSVAFAESLGVRVVALDMGRPFTAARARNEGFAALKALVPGLRFVQFIDGDCEVVSGWLETAVAALENESDAAVVCGRRRERFPEASVYNRMCDLEWDTPIGLAKYCGGDAMFKFEALEQAGGYNAGLIAGEEPELCVRLRAMGWKVRRLDAEMTLHDAAIQSFGQWWKRTVRTGHAAAEGAALHGQPPERHMVKQVKSMTAWGLVLPLVLVVLCVLGVLLSVWCFALAGLLLLGYPLMWLKVYRHRRGRGAARCDARVYATFTLLGKFANVRGAMTYWMNRLRGKRSGLIEYKAEVG